MGILRFNTIEHSAGRRWSGFDSLMSALLLLLAALPAEAIEEAEYVVALRDGAVEIRDYAPQIVAEVSVDEEFEEAGDRAFRPLFNYISGENVARDEIAMTAPVSQERASREIAMTAPVSQERQNGRWTVSFMMPSHFTVDTIPEPTNDAVRIRQVAPYRAAVIRYSGFWSAENYQRHLDELTTWLEAKGLEARGEPVWARYNGPFTPWFLRRNEIIIPLAG